MRGKRCSDSARAQCFNPVQENGEAVGAVILPRQLFSHSASACYLLELGYQPFDIIRGLGTRIGVSILCPSADTPQSLVGEGVGHCVGFTQIPRFQLLADDANQRVLTPTSSTSLAQPLLQGQAIAIVVISHNNESGTRLPPISQCVGDIAVKILLPFVGYAAERQSGK